MQTFLEFYNKNSDQLNEFTWGQLGKGLLRVGKNFFGKRNIGVFVNLLTSLKSIDRSTYNFVQGVLTNNFKNKNKKQKVYVKQIYKGEINDDAKKLGGYENIKNQIQDISVYLTNKGGKITTFYLLSEDDEEKFYIGTNWQGDKNFKDIFGMWVTSLTSRLNYIRKSEKNLNNVLNNPKEYLSEPENEPENEPTNKIPDEENFNEIGLLDISKDEYENLKEIWGDGKGRKESNSIKGLSYPFRGKFNRSLYYNPKTEYNGYKYFNKDFATYLIDTGDNKNALLVFNGRDSHDWAKRIGMLSYWKSDSNKNPIEWKEGTINDLE